MADVWKSQGRKFCEICKVWFGDNRASIEFHERGRKHKAALDAKLRELGKATREKEKMQSKMNSALAAMEAAALKSMKEHGEAIVQGPALPSTGLASKIFDPRQLKDVGSFAREMAKRKNEMSEMRSQKRVSHTPAPPVSAKVFKQEITNIVDYSEFTAPALKEEPEPVPHQIVWAEADGGNGRSYYFNIYTGESTWDQPKVFYTKEQYAALTQSADNPCANAEVPVMKKEESSSSDCNGSEVASIEIPQAEAPAVPKVKTEPCEEEAANVPHDICDIPLPGPSCGNASTNQELPTVSTDSNQEAHIDSTAGSESEEIPPKAAAESIVSDEGVKTEVADESQDQTPRGNSEQVPEPLEEETPAQSSGPLGSWTRVKKVDSGPVFSPLTAKYRAEQERERKAAEAREKETEKLEPLIFTEKTSAVLTKKVKGPIEFKKRSATKHVRQRGQ
uniref:WW domain-binding protein 4 n=1 Tax=Haemonchus contortus TaxID=6289 RepID=A0A7I5EBC4_HAECO|nr:Zinc finger and WW Rsp5 WWP domain containing protein [Haemonchus contortus]